MAAKRTSTPTSHDQTRSGSASIITLLAVTAVIAGSLYYTAKHSPTLWTASIAAPSSPFPLSSRLDVSASSLLRDAGLDAAALATVGVDDQEVGTVVAAALVYVTQHGTTHTTAMSTVKQKKQLVGSLEAVAQSGIATQQQIEDLAAARSDSATAQSALTSARAALITAATASLTNGQKASLANIRDARASGVDLPLAFLVTYRTEAERTAIRNALAEVRIAAGGSVSQASLDILAAAREDDATEQAELDCQNCEAVQVAWLAALD